MQSGRRVDSRTPERSKSVNSQIISASLWRSQNEKVLGRGSRHGGSGYSLVEGDQAAAFLDGKREEVNIREGFGREDAAMVEAGRIEDRDAVGPEGVFGSGGEGLEQVHQFCDRELACFAVAGRGHDAHNAILGQRTACPLRLILPPPGVGAGMESMILIQAAQ